MPASLSSQSFSVQVCSDCVWCNRFSVVQFCLATRECSYCENAQHGTGYPERLWSFHLWRYSGSPHVAVSACIGGWTEQSPEIPSNYSVTLGVISLTISDFAAGSSSSHGVLLPLTLVFFQLISDCHHLCLQKHMDQWATGLGQLSRSSKRIGYLHGGSVFVYRLQQILVLEETGESWTCGWHEVRVSGCENLRPLAVEQVPANLNSLCESWLEGLACFDVIGISITYTITTFALVSENYFWAKKQPL